MKNIKKKAAVAATISGLTVAMTGVLTLNPINSDVALAAKNAEKCAGIARKGLNDCGANGHACGGYATVDGDPNEWIYVPTGMCGKIKGGRSVGATTHNFGTAQRCEGVGTKGEDLLLPSTVCNKIYIAPN